MGEIKEHLDKRREEKRNARNSSWFSLIIKILLLVFIISIFRVSMGEKGEKLKEIFYHNEVRADK